MYERLIRVSLIRRKRGQARELLTFSQSLEHDIRRAETKCRLVLGVFEARSEGQEASQRG